MSMPLCTKFQYYCLKALGMDFCGQPRYLSAKIWFDRADYTKIHIGKRVTISSNIRILTHDWSPDTIAEGIAPEERMRIGQPIGILKDVHIGDYSFIGTGALLLPGCNIGKYVIIGAGAVVRGIMPDYSIVIGNPCIVIERYQILHSQNTLRTCRLIS